MPVGDILGDRITLHMRTDPLRIPDDATVAGALDHVRLNPPAGRVVYFYVVDAAGRLLGVVPTRKLLLSAPEDRVGDIMVKPVVAIPSSATVLEACEYFTKQRLLAFPVLDEDGGLAGVVDVDLYTSEIPDIERREASDNLFQLIGVHLTEAEQKRPALAFRRRFPWLLCNVLGGMLAALLSDAYEDVATLAFVTPFIALVTALAESVAIQSVSLALQSMHERAPDWAELGRKIARELATGLLLGVGCGLAVGATAFLWKHDARAGLALLAGVGGGVAASAAIGLALPYLLKLLRRDPQVASGPIALALADMVTLALYFTILRRLVGG